MNDTISIKEYAKIKGVSVQSVYKRLDSTLKPYVVQPLNDRGKPQKRLKIEVLEDKAFNSDSTPIQPNSTPIQPGVEQPLNNPEMASGNDLTAFLMKQIEIKDEQIKSLQAQNDKLLEALQAAQILQAKQMLQPPPDEPEQQKGFRAWWHSFWYGTTPQK